MKKIRVYEFQHNPTNESFCNILNEISEITPQTTFTKEQEEGFLKDAIVIFEYLKSGIDIKSSEILINNGEIPLSFLEKILTKFSEKLRRMDSKIYSFKVYKSKEGNPVKIYELQDNENKEVAGNSDILLDMKHVPMKRKILFIKSCSSKHAGAVTKSELQKMIDYALKNEVIVLYDATSSKDSEIPENVKSIYEIENAKKVAIEFRRFSSVDDDKLNCGYLVIPECLRLPEEGDNRNKSFKIKEILKEEIKKGNVSRKSLKKSFLNYAYL